jgi:hypothetical protein
MEKQFYLKAFSFVLFLLLCFRVCTINENIKYNINIYPQEKAHTLNSHNENNRVLALFNRKSIDLESHMDMEPNLLTDVLFQFLSLIVVFVFVQPIFDIRKKIAQLIIRCLNGSTYKDSLYFS